jgi:hypothetical protein
MTKQNITLSIRKDILKKIKTIAGKQNTSVSALLTVQLEEMIAREEGYQAARIKHLNMLREKIDLGTQGSITWSRDELQDG